MAGIDKRVIPSEELILADAPPRGSRAGQRTTAGGGTAFAGVAFRVDTSGNETVLHTFTGGADGGTPFAGVILGPGGKLYGTSGFGGPTNAGVVYEIKP